MTRSETFSHVRSNYFRAVRDGKPRIAADCLRSAIINGTAAEVTAFIVQVQQDMGKQDLGLLPETTWRLDAKGPRGWNNDKDRETANVTTLGLRTVLDSESVTELRIDWPSGTFHWGVAIFWTDGGNDYRAFSKDYTPTDSYLQN